MDLNYLYFRHQLSLMRAAAASCVEARTAHRGLAQLYALAIDATHLGRPAAAESRPSTLARRVGSSSREIMSNVARA